MDVIDEILSIALDPISTVNKYAVDLSSFNRKNGQLDVFLRSASMLDFLQSALIKISKLDLRSKSILIICNIRNLSSYKIVMDDIYSLQRLYFDAVQANMS